MMKNVYTYTYIFSGSLLLFLFLNFKVKILNVCPPINVMQISLMPSIRLNPDLLGIHFVFPILLDQLFITGRRNQSQAINIQKGDFVRSPSFFATS